MMKKIDVPKRRVCANCKQTYIEGDKYCRFCGAPMGKPDFIDENFACIYGPPPVKRKHKCKECGYQWITDLMIDEEVFCPNCGGQAPVFEGDEIHITLKYKESGRWINRTVCVSEDRDATIGRLPECDAAIGNKYISRKQFRIFLKEGAGQNVFIENTGRTNPAYINGKHFDGTEPLKSGDEIKVGNKFFILAYYSCD